MKTPRIRFDAVLYNIQINDNIGIYMPSNKSNNNLCEDVDKIKWQHSALLDSFPILTISRLRQS